MIVSFRRAYKFQKLFKVARVTLHGNLNGSPFTISRTKTSTKGSLVFQFNGADLTAQSIKETQQLIEEKLGINSSLLSRTMFHGQHSLNDLLEATDAKLKEELSLVVPLGLWQEAATLARAKSRESGKMASELNGMITLRTEDVEKLKSRLRKAEQEAKEKQASLQILKDQLEEENKRLSGFESMDRKVEVDFGEIELRLEQVKSELGILESRYMQLVEERDAEIGPLERSFHDLSNSLSTLKERCQSAEREVLTASIKLEAARELIRGIEGKWSVDLSMGRPGWFAAPETCPTCFQPVSSKGIGHTHADLNKIAVEEIDKAILTVRTAEIELDNASGRLGAAKEARSSREKMVQDMKDDLEKAQIRWNYDISNIQEEIEDKNKHRTNLTEQFSILARQTQRHSRFDAMNASIRTEQSAVDYTNATFTSLSEELKEEESRLEELKAKMEEQNKLTRTMAELGESFGQRGVQTFVLQNVVDVLQTLSQNYLDDLSDGSQRLELSLDAGDRISRTAYVLGAAGDMKQRPLSTLSGGQWRRCSLALTFGFADLVARRGKMRPSMIVLDEPLTHLDRTGRTKVGHVIRNMLHPITASGGGVGLGGLGLSTILLILQDLAAEELEEAFDVIDEVVREGGTSYVKIDERSV